MAKIQPNTASHVVFDSETRKKKGLPFHHPARQKDPQNVISGLYCEIQQISQLASRIVKCGGMTPRKLSCTNVKVVSRVLPAGGSPGMFRNSRRDHRQHFLSVGSSSKIDFMRAICPLRMQAGQANNQKAHHQGSNQSRFILGSGL